MNNDLLEGLLVLSKERVVEKVDAHGKITIERISLTCKSLQNALVRVCGIVGQQPFHVPLLFGRG